MLFNLPKRISLKAFTLVELLVVVAIICVMIVATVILIDPAKQIGRAKDSKAQQDVRSTATSVSACLSYADQLTGSFNSFSNCDSIAELSGTCSGGCTNAAGSPFMKIIPSGVVQFSSTISDVCVSEMGNTAYWKFTSSIGKVYSDASGC